MSKFTDFDKYTVKVLHKKCNLVEENLRCYAGSFRKMWITHWLSHKYDYKSVFLALRSSVFYAKVFNKQSNSMLRIRPINLRTLGSPPPLVGPLPFRGYSWGWGFEATKVLGSCRGTCHTLQVFPTDELHKKHETLWVRLWDEPDSCFEAGLFPQGLLHLKKS